MTKTEILKIILDFDGTLTNVEKEARPVLEKKAELFCERTGMPRIILEVLLREAEQEVLRDPKAGWTYNGLVVAPATADPYIFDTACYSKILEKLEKDLQFNVPREQKSREEFLQKLFHDSYPYAAAVFREGAKEFLEELASQYTVVVVTNSQTDPVKKKMEKLGDFDIPIFGGAKKYAVENAWENVPESIQPENFPRPVLLRRHQYNLLLSILGFEPKETAVVGDIFELDLALPQHLGYRAGLLQTLGTQKHEKKYMESQPNSFLAKNFGEVVRLLKE